MHYFYFSEIVNEIGNPPHERKNNLLSCCYQLVRLTETPVPVVFNFLMEFLSTWDEISHMPRVMD